MNRILYYLIVLEFCIFAQDSKLAILKSVQSNSKQIFSIKQVNFLCKAYGIVSIDELYQESKSDSSCREAIDTFYRQNPNDKYFTARILKNRQTYHVEFRNKECIVYASGLNTLSELLLSKGLAVKQTTFKDEEFDFAFNEAEMDAKENNLGLYKNKIKYKCISELTSIERKNS